MPYVGRTPSAVPVTADDIPANSIDASKIIDGAIAVADVADNAITEAKIADAAVVSLKSGRKNLIINGGMQVWQRGTTTSGSTTYRVDRFRPEPRSGTVVGWDRSTDVPAGQGFGHSSRIYAPNATDDGFHWYTSVELPDVNNHGVFSAGTEMVLSFWIKSAYSGRNVNPVIMLKDLVFGSNSTDPSYSAEGNTAIPTTWTKLTFTYTMPTWVASTGDLSLVKCAAIRHLVGTNNTPQDIYITGVQLELGSVATDFEHRSYGEELALCQRYYYASPPNGDAVSGAVYRYSYGNSNFHSFFPVWMRSVPTVTGSNISTNRSFRDGITFNPYSGEMGGWAADAEL